MPKPGTVLHPVTGCRVDSLFEDVWLISAEQLDARLQQVVKIDLHELVKMNREDEAKLKEAELKAGEGGAAPSSKLPYEMSGSIAVIEISGVTTKYPTSFGSLLGGTSTVNVQKAIRHALANEDVSEIMLHIDGCPGGNAAGAFDLADEIIRADKVKPILAHIDDQGTSGGQLFASQARWTTANKNAQIGSVGVLSKLFDTSKKYEMSGIKVIPIVAGKMKGVGMDGVKISAADIKDAEERVAEIQDLFVSAVAEGRGLKASDILQLEARTMIAERGRKFGLIDAVSNYETALASVKGKKYPEAAKRGPVPEIKPQAAARSRVMLTPEQLIQAKALPGAAHVTAENADGVLLHTASSMVAELSDLREFKSKAESSKAPAKLTPAQAESYVKLFIKDLEFQVKDGKMTPAQFDLVKATLNPTEGKYAIGLVQGDGSVLLPSDIFTKAVELNKPNGVQTDATGAQPAPRTEPGKSETKPPSFEQVNASRAGYQLAPITMEQYKQTFPDVSAK